MELFLGNGKNLLKSKMLLNCTLIQSPTTNSKFDTREIENAVDMNFGGILLTLSKPLII